MIAVLPGCKSRTDSAHTQKVRIEKKDKKFTLYRNGKPFEIRGASGYSHFKTLKNCGGNTVRIWDTTGLQTILDSAVANDIAVVVGLPVRHSEDLAFYNDPEKVKKQYLAFSRLINRHKHNPAILMWCVGNELTFPVKFSYQPFYQAFNNLTDMIHRDDPNHPVTTTILNFNQKYIANMMLRCDIDLISFNIFGKLPQLRQDLEDFSWFWDGPYMLLEWGINGPWPGTEQTAWSAYLEDTSWKKAEIYRERYQRDMPLKDPRFLGASVFFWGNKQETTDTWFSLFDENGAASEVVGTMEYLWKGKMPATHYPDISFMLLDEKGGSDNIMLDPREVVSARIVMPESSGDFDKIQWKVCKEDWYKQNNENSTRRLPALPNVVVSEEGLQATVTAPAEEGPYRLFATVYADNGTYATCNTPFYVVGK
ncbi:hypothetical protein FEN17_25930 [Dyadobacter luticola]|uniref:Glycoside hydrolase family 2 catalytic domain-containing protein n=1 Tax=Dyadobacter luticola TaxID=1979387 RepID=A0A5R9KQD3_9BACT|nr:hypothetical protein FEN17_25930 [Dyadobacter luticola]